MLDISNFPFAECVITENRIANVSDSLALRRSRRDTGVHRYEFELVTIDMDLKQGRNIKAKLSAAVNDTLEFIHPRLSYSGGTIPTDEISTNGANPVGYSSVNLSCVSIWQLLAGDYFTITGDTKVYEVAEDTELKAGAQTVKLTFPLRSTLADNSVVTANDVKWTLVSNGEIEAAMVASDNQDIELTLIAVEKL